LRSSLPVSDEQGVEAYYTMQIVDDLKFTVSGQLVDPALENARNSANINLRAVVDF
jgi:hypothetical protein